MTIIDSILKSRYITLQTKAHIVKAMVFPGVRYGCESWTVKMAELVKNLPATQETWVPSGGQEDSLEKGMATHSSILAWRISLTEEPGRLQFMESQRVGYN